MVGVVGYMHDATNPRWDEMVTIVGRKDRGIEEGNIQSVMGKRIGTTAGGTGDQYIKTLFKQMSLPADKIELLPVVGANWQSSITTGSVDALVAWEPYITQILDQVPNLAVVKKGGGVVGYMTMFSTSQKLVQERPDLVKRFVTAFAEAQQYVRLHRDEAAEISTRWIAGLDLPTARKTISYMPYDPRLTKYSMQNWDEAVQDLLDQKKIKRAIAASEAMNTTFIDQVQKEHPEFFTDLKPIP
jgi:NitT/TauT family transport system substrate-binding protein/sulfonate transport system substrate-binding protein